MADPTTHSVTVEVAPTRAGAEYTGAIVTCVPSAGPRTVQVVTAKTPLHEALELATGRTWERTPAGIVTRTDAAVAIVSQHERDAVHVILQSVEFGDILESTSVPAPADVAVLLARWPEFCS